MRLRAATFTSLLALTLPGCDQDRITKLENQNAVLREQLASLQKSGQLELQAKCGKDAREWYSREWQADKDTVMISYTNHYSSHFNKCFITINWNYNLGPNSVQKMVVVYDVYENAKIAEFSELHMMALTPPKVVAGLCSVANVECSSFDEFSKKLQPYAQ
jgi:hypothetical protein